MSDMVCWECGEAIATDEDVVRRTTVMGDIWLHRECLAVFEAGQAEERADARRDAYLDNESRL